MLEKLKNTNPIILMRYLLFSLISLSFILSIYANFLDLLNPGSEKARVYENLVYFLLFLSIFLIIPLLHEKIAYFQFKIEKYKKLEKNAKKQQIWALIKAHFRGVLLYLLIFVVSVLVFEHWFTLNAEIIQNHQKYYTHIGVLK